jgi:hypothetical protein
MAVVGRVDTDTDVRAVDIGGRDLPQREEPGCHVLPYGEAFGSVPLTPIKAVRSTVENGHDPWMTHQKQSENME